ncbi:GtrA family protein [Candidatus Woesearchaeota archaeon]|nr:GtrA family protein [Candidatus Woesearchaeota archaeon]
MQVVKDQLRKHRQFVKYAVVGVIVSILNIVALWLLIDWLHIPTLIASTGVVVALFILKFWMYRVTGFTQA